MPTRMSKPRRLSFAHRLRNLVRQTLSGLRALEALAIGATLFAGTIHVLLIVWRAIVK
jgi:hypothetical protein